MVDELLLASVQPPTPPTFSKNAASDGRWGVWEAVYFASV